MLNYCYVPIITVDFPYFPVNLNSKTSEQKEINQALEKILDIVVNEIELNQQYSNLNIITLL